MRDLRLGKQCRQHPSEPSGSQASRKGSKVHRKRANAKDRPVGPPLPTRRLEAGADRPLDATPLDEIDRYHDDCDDEEDMNESSHRVRGDETQ